MSSNTRGRNMVQMVVSTPNHSKDTSDSSIFEKSSKKEVTTKIVPVCNIYDFDALWAHAFSYDKYSKILTPEVEYASTLNMTQADLQKQLDLLKREYHFHETEDDFSISLLCDETMPSSILNVTLVDIAMELEEMCAHTSESKNVNEENTVQTTNKPEGNMDETMDGAERIMDDGNNEAKENMDVTNKETKGNIDRGTNEIERIVDVANVEAAGNMNDANTTNEENIAQDVTNQELQENCTDDETNANTGEGNKGLTKSGKPRLRRKYEQSVDTRIKNKKRLKLEKMSVKPGCNNETCRRKCSTFFTENERENINKLFWEQGYEAQGIYIKSLVIAKEVNRRIRESRQMRKITYTYFLEANNEKHEVCKIFFLTTLGYAEKNDRRVLDILKKPLNAQADKRSKLNHPKKINREQLKEHIESFRPAVAHYRRAHAPNRRYLPSDINATTMYTDFITKNPDVKISYDLYRKFLKKDMNISFAQLGNEECELCESYKLHKDTCKDTEECSECASYRSHSVKYQMARSHYQEDAELSKSGQDPSKVYFSADLQKVVLLPRLDMFKIAMFCPRIIAFNESFVPLGASSKDKPYAVLWHEGISGRKKEDIICAYRAFFLSKRDCTEITIWTDNCSGQNKNWTFFSFLVQIINSLDIVTTKIIMKYLEPGHTFMSADSFHHQVENQLQKAKKVYDFADYIDCVQLANSQKVYVKPLDVPDFYKYEDHSSQYKLKKHDERTYIKNIVSVEVHRNSMSIFVKDSHDGRTKEIDFLKTKIIKQGSIPCPVQNTMPRGITQERKSGILKKLGDLIPKNRLLFWENLPVNNDSIDLVEHRDSEE